jgi:phosphatidylserine/phosphatidylglycerophosphate/cardiolipin synthase-like enzyme
MFFKLGFFRSFLILFMMGSSISVTHAQDNPFDSDTEFKIDFKTLAQYYLTVSDGLIQPNPDAYFETRDHTPLSFNHEDLTFTVNPLKNIITPNIVMSPESVQSLFKFDTLTFTKKMGGSDFVDAKVNYFKSLNFDPKTQRFQRLYHHLTDWKSLIHPPVRDVGNTPEEQDQFFHTDHRIPHDSSMLTADFNRKIDAISDSELTRGNKTKLLINGDSYLEKLNQVKNAKKSIYVMVMSFASDPSSFALIDALVEKQKQGVEVQVILEKLWTTTVFRNTMQRFIDGGVKLLLADDMFHLRKSKRTLFHNKIWIFDDQTVIVGGQNIVNSSNNSTGFNHWNKDIDVRIEGPMVTDIISEFTTLKERYDEPTCRRKTRKFNLDQGRSTEDLKEMVSQRKQLETEQGHRGKNLYDQWFLNQETATDGVCRFVIQGTQKNNFILANTYSEFFRFARNELFLTSQHVNYDIDEMDDGDEENDDPATMMFQSIYDSASNGVNVNLLTNGIDGGFAEIGQNIAMGRRDPKREVRRQQILASHIARGKEPITLLGRLSRYLGLKSTQKFRKYLDNGIAHPGFNAWMHFQYVHSKTVLIDNVLSSIGSFNFEPFSAEHSHESAIFCYDRQLAADLKTDYVRDIVNSTPVLPLTSDDPSSQQ